MCATGLVDKRAARAHFHAETKFVYWTPYTKYSGYCMFTSLSGRPRARGFSSGLDGMPIGPFLGSAATLT
jgi:hypothetical protein